MSVQTFRKPLVALTATAMIASSLILVSPANATEGDPSAATTQVETTPEPTDISTPESTEPAAPAATSTTPAPLNKPKQATKPQTRAKSKSKYKKAPSLARVRAGKAVLKVGMRGAAVKSLQKRLISAGYFKIKANGIYGKKTGKAVDGIREKRFMAESTTANSRVVRALWSMTGKRNRVPSICRKEKVALCASKTQKVLRYYKRGKLVRVFDARFGQENSKSKRTRLGNFRVYAKIPNGTSSLAGTWMPWAMYFSGGQAIHYSGGFKSVGYYGASLGCINIRDFSGVKWLYKKIQRGTLVKVYK